MIDIETIQQIVVNIRYAITSVLSGRFDIPHILIEILTYTVPFIFLWWAVRKAYKAIIAATTKGKSKI